MHVTVMLTLRIFYQFNTHKNKK